MARVRKSYFSILIAAVPALERTILPNATSFKPQCSFNRAGQLSLGGKQNAAARNVLRPAAAGLRNAFGLQQLIADVVLEGKPVGGPPIGCREILAVTAHRFLFSNSIM